MPAYITLPCGTVLKTSGISRLVPMDKDQDDINRRCSKPTLVVHHGSSKIRVEFKTTKERDEWVSNIVSNLNNPSKA